MACLTCSVLDNLPLGFTCIVDSQGRVAHLLPEDYLEEYPERVLDIAQRAVSGDPLLSGVLHEHFGGEAQTPTFCFRDRLARFLREDVLLVYSELVGMDTGF